MKVSRRGAFGIGAGAIVAGPAAAQEAIKSVADHSSKLSAYGIIGGYNEGAKECVSTSSDDWVRRVSRIAKGEFSDDELRDLERASRGDSIAHNVDALRSCSQIGRQKIYERRCFEHNKLRRIQEARDDLIRMGKQWLLG